MYRGITFHQQKALGNFNEMTWKHAFDTLPCAVAVFGSLGPGEAQEKAGPASCLHVCLSVFEYEV